MDRQQLLAELLEAVEQYDTFGVLDDTDMAGLAEDFDIILEKYYG